MVCCGIFPMTELNGHQTSSRRHLKAGGEKVGSSLEKKDSRNSLIVPINRGFIICRFDFYPKKSN